MGGKSTASMQAIEGGTNGSRGALKVNGEIVPGANFTWAGALFHPGSEPNEAVNLSNKKSISFWAKGDGKNYAVAVVTETNAGGMPGIQQFVPGPEWKQFSFPLANFGTDGHDITGIVFARAQEEGKFEFEIDEIEIK